MPPPSVYRRFWFWEILLLDMGDGLGQGLLLDQVALTGDHDALRLGRAGAVHGLGAVYPLLSSHLPRAPDDRDIPGLRWRGCHNSAASFYSCAAGFPPSL